MRYYFVVCVDLGRLGNWKLEQWHLFRQRQTGNVKGTVHWMEWRCLFCGTPDYRHVKK